jgi:hypothetical protein
MNDRESWPSGRSRSSKKKTTEQHWLSDGVGLRISHRGTENLREKEEEALREG